ncbi:IQ domain-containing protein/DUF4005 domain-containing protein [Cephalotus follicularis]|uniref:IQ domain-containing protein/DUF4005 domain-containing protein n=1 Tax=Cephalotus follicularis TaxID=3775 RepID=A0A1Q3BIR8_CEPFO|nr:IQ domain-containing protein/DUF4005 domain-containing protein [Cephalotus follicularis]
MGRSTACFKIIACGSDSADKDDLEVTESKASGDKRGWSFRRRSARHRVLSNTVISETTSSGKQESPESAPLNIQPPDNPIVPEIISLKQYTDEKTQLSAPVDLEPQLSAPVALETQLDTHVYSEPQFSTLVDSKVCKTIGTISKEDDVNLDDSVVIVIQSAVRGFLGQKELVKLKNVVKLQAAVRGHLVRRHAVGTLRCVQAIVKMQVLVRARRARLSLEGSGSYTEKNLDLKQTTDNCNSKASEKENSATKSNITYTSIEKLLSNRFARQLMESTPMNKPINIKCDVSKPNSAWNWLERWVTVSSLKSTPKLELMAEHTEREKNENGASPMDYQSQSEIFCEPAVKSSIEESIVPSECEENLITYDADHFQFQSLVRENLEQRRLENTSTYNAKVSQMDINSVSNQTIQVAVNSLSELHSLPCKPELESELPKRSMKRYASEQLETEGKNFVLGSRKASNPAFVAAQTKFEGLSSTANSGKSIGSSYQDVGVESNIDTVSSETDTIIIAKELSIPESQVLHRNQVGGSECGTELSVTSTLDSPDRSEVGNLELEHQAKVPDPNSRSVDVEAKDASSLAMSNFSYSVTDEPDKYDDANCKCETFDSQQVELKPEGGVSDLQRQPESETGHQAYRSSPEASPRSHITVQESQGTPSSQVSLKAKKKKTDKSQFNQKRAPLSAGKRSPLNQNHESSSRNSMELLHKDQKNGKRRKSFGSPKLDHVDQEPGDSSSSSSIPHFMQATESARAKVNANNSPRSSPDVLDRDIYIKKRHSLPGTNGRQGSPRIQRSMSQAQEVAKGNGSHPHDRKWQR